MKPAVLVGAALLACASASHTQIAPGRFIIECKRSQSNCWKEAAKMCPGGYDQIDSSQRSGTHHTVNAYNGQYMGSVPTFNGEMLVECRSQAAAAQ